jgi:monoamine oxidase
MNAKTKQVVYDKDDALPLSALGKLDALQMMWRVDSRLRSFRNDLDTLDRVSAAAFIEDVGFTDEAIEAFLGYAESEMCSSPDLFSAYELLDQLTSVGGTDGEADSAQWCLKEGMSAVIDGLAIPVLANVKLNSPVNAINASPDGYVSTAGDDFRAKRLLVTVPPQLYGRLGMKHLLSAERRSAIEGYVQGSVVKTILVFQEPWWRERGASGRGLSQGGMFGSVIDASPADGSAGILVIFSTASWAKRLQKIEDTKSRVEAALRWLADLAGQEVPRPIDAFSVDWSADPWALGGYASRRGVGGWLNSPELFHPHNGIHFAGSETADEWRSFAEGALQSAERATLEIEGSGVLRG